MQTFYKYKSIINQPRATHRIASQCCHLMRVVLYYSLQTFYKHKSIITLLTVRNASHRRVVISCVCRGITACKHFTNTKASSLYQPIATQRIASPCCHLMRVVLYYSLQTFYKHKSIITLPTESNASHHHSTNR